MRGGAFSLSFLLSSHYTLVLPPNSNTQIRGHMTGPLLPLARSCDRAKSNIYLSKAVSRRIFITW